MDNGYPCIPLLMIPHKQNVNVKLHIVLEALANKQLSKWGRSSSKMHLAFLKKHLENMFLKSNLHIFHACDVVACCCMLYNLILDGHDVDVHALIL